jgi:Tol biopolymer transport system component
LSFSRINVPERLTHSNGNDQLLYFTSTSVLPNDSGLVFISDRTGHPNLFFLDFRSKKEHQLTANAEGKLKSYVYFDGNPYRGFGKASVSLDPDRGLIYYIQGRQIRSVNLEGKSRTLAELPAGQMTAFTHVSTDGTRLCVPTTDARALDDENPLPAAKPDYGVDERIQAEGLSSYLRIYDTATGREIQTAPVPRAWVTHVQFSPIDREKILYNHEWVMSHWGTRRMWLWDGSKHLQLRQETAPGDTPARSRNDWTCHEMWERDGSAIIYHGTYDKAAAALGGVAYLGRIQADGTGVKEIAFPPDWGQYGHFTVGKPGQLVTDGYYRTEERDECWAGRWLSLLKVNWEQGKIDWTSLARHGSSWSSQDAHPHPIIDEKCENVYFTSDREGNRAIYRLSI